ncbi:MAG: hypothetical protein M3Q99_16845 [Acidobacteriota bacterium]|nr:hypothetical protein [Acidobacteriota bacterium]
MQRNIYKNQINSAKRKGRIVVGEFEIGSDKMVRAIIEKTSFDKDTVETIYGNLFPTAIYSFDHAVEAQKFLNAA